MPDPVIVVIDRVPAFGAGLEAILAGDGFEVATPVRPSAWLRRREVAAAVVTLRGHEDVDRLQELSEEFTSLVLVAVLSSSAHSVYATALRSGAHAAVSWDSAPGDILAVVRAAMAGRTVLPTPTARALAKSAQDRPQGTGLRPQEVQWLRVLAGGGSVVQLARVEGYSQREVFRRLSTVYRRMGARNRQEAIALAGQWGLLAPASR
ncbi:hypothetical protein DMH03_32460 [Amycolatopsis sp. WAC 01376]|uniref:LuxR C-terminal-related transcriptional regulator n=1 Tax=Amycolatopsis sp. WAC 01376 TaxID=2203195 RepID=UPI000F79254E|nr:LuxR C-terminal-related transcriptional regulator [Amycolatopsis sp. WAC 01376]RSM56210.1 hypothetical protein DMH03_32460 [Amycolatopsis sp. WAC 01376]